MLALGTPAPPFALPEPATGATVSLDELTGPALVVTFICNHCPYVQHVAAGLAALGRDLTDQGVAMVGISSNDVVTYPQDGPDQMVAEARRHGWTFPYLYDETQDVARAFSAACTPDTFVFDGERRLVYRGQLDDSRPRNDLPVTAADVRAAVDAVLAGRPVTPTSGRRSGAASSGVEPGSRRRHEVGCRRGHPPGNAQSPTPVPANTTGSNTAGYQ